MRSSSRIAIVAIGLALVMGAVLLVMPVAGPKAEGDLARSKPSDGGLFSVTIAPETANVARGQLHAWVLTLTTPDGRPVEEARFVVTGGMPAHNHGLPTVPEATAYLGEGRYRIDGVKFTMSGQWDLTFAITAPVGSDTATFHIQQ